MEMVGAAKLAGVLCIPWVDRGLFNNTLLLDFAEGTVGFVLELRMAI